MHELDELLEHSGVKGMKWKKHKKKQDPNSLEIPGFHKTKVFQDPKFQELWNKREAENKRIQKLQLSGKIDAKTANILRKAAYDKALKEAQAIDEKNSPINKLKSKVSNVENAAKKKLGDLLKSTLGSSKPKVTVVDLNDPKALKGTGFHKTKIFQDPKFQHIVKKKDAEIRKIQEMQLSGKIDAKTANILRKAAYDKGLKEAQAYDKKPHGKTKNVDYGTNPPSQKKKGKQPHGKISNLKY